MPIRFAINGLGRVGRALLRIAHGRADLLLAAVNDVAPAPRLARLVARDTAHENQLTQRLTGAPSVTRVQTLQTIRTSRHLAGVPL